MGLFSELFIEHTKLTLERKYLAKYNRLSVLQKNAAECLLKQSYQFKYIRGKYLNIMAVFQKGNKLVTVTYDGDVGFFADIKYRKFDK